MIKGHDLISLLFYVQMAPPSFTIQTNNCHKMQRASKNKHLDNPKCLNLDARKLVSNETDALHMSLVIESDNSDKCIGVSLLGFL